MPTSALGNRTALPGHPGHTRRLSVSGLRHSRGFSLIELMVVLAIIALGVGMVVLALPDGDESKLEEEGERLSALLEMARAEARVSGGAVRWVPRAENLLGATPAAGNQAATDHFAFSGLPLKVTLPTRWLDSRTRAQVRGASFLVLGPDAILPAQSVLLSLGKRRLELATDGLAPFSPTQATAANDVVATTLGAPQTQATP